jgi:nucleotide-binding universal stress UspA family protein
LKESLRVLVPLDGSADAESILGAVLPLARQRPIQLTLLGVVPKHSPLHSTESYLGRVEKALRRQRAEVCVQSCLGDPVAAILKHATPEKADLLAMATHGRSGLERLLMGSVAEEVVRHATIPIIVSRPGCRMAGWSHVVTLDGSVQAEAVLDDIVPLSRLLGATLHFLQVEPDGPRLGLHPEAKRAWDVVARNYLEQLAAQARARAVSVVVEVRRGRPDLEILRYAAEVRAGLVAMATHGRTGFPRAILGSVAEAVLRKVSCPVMLRRMNGSPRVIEAGTVVA